MAHGPNFLKIRHAHAGPNKLSQDAPPPRRDRTDSSDPSDWVTMIALEMVAIPATHPLSVPALPDRTSLAVLAPQFFPGSASLPRFPTTLPYRVSLPCIPTVYPYRTSPLPQVRVLQGLPLKCSSLRTWGRGTG